MRAYRLLAGVILAFATIATLAQGKPKTENVILVMTDGVRWQEVFGGADDELMNKERGGVEKLDPLKKTFGAGTKEERRAALLPFVWKVMAQDGQLYGNQLKKSVGRVGNGHNFSYPGYSEALCGFVDPRINSNAKRNNPNKTVLEWLHDKQDYKGKIAAFTTWDVFPFIINTERSGIPVLANAVLPDWLPATPALSALQQLNLERKQLGEEDRFDAFTFAAALEYIGKNKPRVVFICFDETDSRCHEGRYDRYLASAHKADRMIAKLWETLQEMPEYKDKTTLILTCDHGRGGAPTGWKSHGAKVEGSEFTWMGFLGPDTPALGERSDVEPVTHDRIAATLAAFLGEDYNAAEKKAGKVIADAIKVEK
jgi:hypothetical protein